MSSGGYNMEVWVWIECFIFSQVPLYETVKKRLGEDNAAHHRFDDMFHGFAAARGDWKDEHQRKRADEAIQLVHHFMKKHTAK